MTSLPRFSKNQSGQALVLVLLSLAVVLTLVLFVLSRSVTDVAVSSRQEESVRAFSAAEAGIEKALVIGTSAGITQIGDASYKADVTSFAEGTQSFNYPIALSSGDSSTTWFVSHDASGNLSCAAGHPCYTSTQLKICWGKPGTASNTNTTPAIEASIYYETTPGDVSTVKIARVTFDPNTSRRVNNSFMASDPGTCQISGVNYAFQRTFPVVNPNINGLQFMRTRMLYNTDVAHQMGVDVNFGGNSTLPAQGQNIVSTGIAGVSNRRIEVFQGWPEIPSIFEYSIYSPSGLTK